MCQDTSNNAICDTGETVIASFVYDADGKRVKSVMGSETTLFIGAHYQVTNPDTPQKVITKYYLAGSQRIAMRVGNTLTFLHSDHLGSTSLTTDLARNETSEMRYTAWGEVRYATTTSTSLPAPYTYTGQYSDSYINLLWYGSRHYDPALGRFIQPDSIVPLASQGVQAWDRYAYVNNSPINYTDPTGHMRVADGPTRDRFSRTAFDRYVPKPWPKPTYGNGLIGPPAPTNNVFTTSFQMFQTTTPFTYSQSAEESYNDFTGGGGDVAPPGVNALAALPGLGIELALGYRPTYLRNNTPYDQYVYLTYETTYQNSTTANPSSVIIVNNMMISNESTTVDSVINYTVFIQSGNGDISPPVVSAAPGETVNVQLDENIVVYSGGSGLNIFIGADTVCQSLCYSNPSSLNYWGNIRFNFNP